MWLWLILINICSIFFHDQIAQRKYFEYGEVNPRVPPRLKAYRWAIACMHL